MCIAIITLLKIRNGRISAWYPRLLKNGILFNIVSPDGNVCTLESECEHGRNKADGVCNNFHNDVSEKSGVKKRGSFNAPSVHGYY
ncbi:hypothetical protein AAA88_004684 [Salmonella enterica subsp. diarizonae]|nr:hypothetical protein [Salmonella enterica subsp. diarizonae]